MSRAVAATSVLPNALGAPHPRGVPSVTSVPVDSPAGTFLAAVSASALALAACGGSDTEDSPGRGSASDADKANGTLVVGSLLAQTGNLSFLGPPQFAGVKPERPLRCLDRVL
jgi:hypothetical protein